MNNKTNKKARKRNRGFSLVELIIVIAIMAILAGVLAPQFIKYIGNSKKSSDIQNAQMIADAVAAQVSQDAVNGATTFAGGADITYGTGTSDKFTFKKVNDSASLKTAVGGTVNVKLDNTKSFFVSVDKDNNVIVYISTSTATSPATTDEIYPELASGSSWK